jgi:hypothetical protein
MTKFETDFIDLVKSYGFTYDVDDNWIDAYFNGESFSALNRLNGLIITFTDFEISYGEICIVIRTLTSKTFKTLKDFQDQLNVSMKKYKDLKMEIKLNRIKEDF